MAHKAVDNKPIVREAHLKVSVFVNQVFERTPVAQRKYLNYGVRNELTNLLIVLQDNIDFNNTIFNLRKFNFAELCLKMVDQDEMKENVRI
jgi:hypothetical protein